MTGNDFDMDIYIEEARGAYCPECSGVMDERDDVCIECGYSPSEEEEDVDSSSMHVA